MLDNILIYLISCAVIVLICSFDFLRKENKKQKIQIEQYKEIIKELNYQLRAARPEQNQTSDFLLADDPMDTLLKDVGKVSKQ